MERNEKSKRIIRKILLSILLILFISGVGFIYYVNKQLNNVTITPLPKEDAELGIRPELDESEEVQNETLQGKSKQEDNVFNIALFGVDSRNSKVDIPHSDCIIIATVDNKHNKIKLSSIMRDTYVEINEHGKTKITEAYFYGGPKLAVRTLNENFNLDIKDYVTVDFAGLIKIVDSLGGINVNVKRHEVREINKWIAELAELQKVRYTPVYKSGVQNLNGIQTVAYCRIRQVGDGDFERTDRQRMVLGELLNKIKETDITRYPYLASELLPYVETSISKSNMITLGGKIMMSDISNLDEQRFPVTGYCRGEIINGIWYLLPEPDIDTLSEQIHRYIYDDVKPVPKEPLF